MPLGKNYVFSVQGMLPQNSKTRCILMSWTFSIFQTLEQLLLLIWRRISQPQKDEEK